MIYSSLTGLPQTYRLLTNFYKLWKLKKVLSLFIVKQGLDVLDPLLLVTPWNIIVLMLLILLDILELRDQDLSLGHNNISWSKCKSPWKKEQKIPRYGNKFRKIYFKKKH